MLNFLRKLRRTEMNNNNGKYLKYAFGEIVLVVIGILIALSLNNWNDNNKALQKEKALLKKVKEENLYNIGFLSESSNILTNKDKHVAEMYKALSQPRSKEIDEEVEELMFDVIQMGMYVFSTQYLEKYINSSEDESSELAVSLLGLKDNLDTFQKASEFTYNYRMANTWPYIEKAFSMVSAKIIDHTSLRDPVFINRLVILENMSTNNYENYKLTLNESQKVDSLITVRLAR